MLLREGHVLPTLNLMYNYEENVGHDEDVRTEALRIVEQTADLENLGQFLARAREDFPENDTFQLQWVRYLMVTDNLDECQIRLTALSERRPNWGKVAFEWAMLDPTCAAGKGQAASRWKASSVTVGYGYRPKAI